MDGIGKKVILEYRWYLVEFFVSRNSFKKIYSFYVIIGCKYDARNSRIKTQITNTTRKQVRKLLFVIWLLAFKQVGQHGDSKLMRYFCCFGQKFTEIT